MSQVEEEKSLQLSPPARLPPSTPPGEKYRMSTAISQISSGRCLLWRLHLCSKHLKKVPLAPLSLSSPSYLFISLFLSFYLFIFYFFSGFGSSYFLNCLTPKIQISQLGPMSFWKMSILLPTSPFSLIFVTINISIYMQIFIYWPRMDKNWSCFHCGAASKRLWRREVWEAGRAAPHLKSK